MKIYIKEPKKIEYVFEEINENANDFFCKTIFTAISPGTEIAAYKGEPHLREGVTQ